MIIAFTREPVMPQHVLTDYALTDTVGDPRDPPAQILPSLIYRRAVPVQAAARAASRAD